MGGILIISSPGILQDFQTMGMRCEYTRTDDVIVNHEINRLRRVNSTAIECSCSVVGLNGNSHTQVVFPNRDTMFTCSLIIQRCPITIIH